MIYKLAKTIHLVALALFLGSVFGHIIQGMVPGGDTVPPTILFVRQSIDVATRYLTIPGLVVLLATGIVMSLIRRGGFGAHRWLTAHQVLGVSVVVIGMAVLVPTGRELLASAQGLVDGALSLADHAALARRESIFGAVNVLLALLALAVVIAKPTLRRRPGTRRG